MTDQAIAFLAGAAGLTAVYHRLRQEFSTAAAGLTTLLLFAATSLFWSMTRAAFPPEAVVFAVVALLAMAAIRPGGRWTRIAAWSALAALPIVVMWATKNGPTTALGAGNALFSVVRGLFSLTPIAYLAAIGMLFYARHHRAVGVTSLMVVLTWIAASSLILTHARAPFDHGLTAALVLLAPGLALLIDAARRKPWLAVAPLVAIFPIWNYWLMVQYTAGALPKDAPVSFAAMVRQQAEVHTRSPYVYPFAFPANVLFAWREGVPVDRYEALVREPRGTQFELLFDRNADRFLLDGWGGVASTPSGPIRWISGRRASLTFPLQRPMGDVAIDLLTAARADESGQSVGFSITLNGHEVGRLNASFVPTNAHVIVPAASVREVLREGYNHLIIVSHDNRRVGVSKIRVGPAT